MKRRIKPFFCKHLMATRLHRVTDTMLLPARNQEEMKYQVFDLTGRFQSETNVCLLRETVRE